MTQRDTAAFTKQQNEQRELEQREVRFRVIEEFLNLRGRNVADIGRWAAILQDDFSLKLPNPRGLYTAIAGDSGEAEFRPEQVLVGVVQVMADAQGFAGFLQTLASSSSTADQGIISLQYHIDRKNFFMDGNNAVLDWTASSVGAVQRVSSSLALVVWLSVSMLLITTLPSFPFHLVLSGRQGRIDHVGDTQGQLLSSVQQDSSYRSGV